MSQQQPLVHEDDWSDKVNLRRHLLRLFSWWREIILSSILVVVVGFVVTQGQRYVFPKYTAENLVLIVSKTSELQNLSAVTSRQAAMLGLVHNGKIASAVLRRLSGQLDEAERNMPWLLKAVSARLATPQSRQNLSDLIRIAATANSPEKALAIASTWSEEYVREANLAWIASGERHDSVMQGISRIVDDYALAQSELKEHITRNEADRIKRQIGEKTLEIEEVAKTLRSSRTDIFNRWRLLHGLLMDARGLHEQIGSAGETGVRSNGLAILLLKTQASTYAADYSSWEFAFDSLNMMHDNVADQKADVDAFIQMLQSQIRRIEAKIVDLSDGPSPDGTSALPGLALAEGLASQHISKLENDLQKMQRRMEEVETERRRLLANRDRMEKAMVDLEDESVEMVVEDAAAHLTLRTVSEAALVYPLPVSLLKSLVVLTVIGIFGFFAAAGSALFLDSLGMRPFLARRSASRD